MTLNLLILGGGNGAHCYSALASSLPDVTVRVLTLYSDEAERWTKRMAHDEFQITFKNFYGDGKDRVFDNKPTMVTNDPSQAVPGSHLIIFMVPAFAHAQYFHALVPHLEPRMIICGLPGGGGFMFQALAALGDDISRYSLLSFSTLPWACRIEEFARSATILAVKDAITGGDMGSTRPTVLGKSPVDTIQHTLLGKTKLELKGHLLGDTLSYGNAFVHPCIEYGTWSNWDGKPLDEMPDFYHGANHLAADMVAATSSESLKMRDAIKQARPDVRLDQVIHKYDWYCRSYSDQIVADKTSLYTIFHTHKGYNGIKHPMVKTADGKYLPDFKHRYFTEDIPYGQVVLKGVAEILGVATPNLDKVITWAQGVMGKEYLVDGRLTGKDLAETRCPQRFGITTLDGMLGETRQ